VTALAGGTGKTIPQVSSEWAMTKATYRFLSNDRVEESEILSGHFSQTAARVEANEGAVLIAHGTTEFSYIRSDPSSVSLAF